MNAATEIKLIEDISEENAPAIYVKGGLQQFLDAVKVEVSAEVPDLTTRKGRDRIASLAAKVSKSKVAVEKPGREYLARLKEMPKEVEAELREFVRAMDILRDETRKPLTDWEEAEEQRVADHQSSLESLRNTITEGASAAMIKSLIADMEAEEIGADWEEFEAEAHRVKAASLATLRDALSRREQYEAEQAELERLRAETAAREQKEREERIAREAAEQAQREAEQRAQAEREAAARRERDAQLAAERRETELKLQAEQAEREKLAAQQRAEQAKRDAEEQAAAAEQSRIVAERQAAQDRIDADRRQSEAVERAAAAERQRQADEQARIEAEARAREADKAHKARINRAALEAFMAGGMPEACAKQAVTLIAQRKIPSIAITY